MEEYFEPIEEKDLEKEIATEMGERREKPNALYFIFGNEYEREKALKLVGEYRQIDDSFSFLKDNFCRDQMNSAGIALEFTKSPEEHRKSLTEFFVRNDLNVKKIYPPEDSMKIGEQKNSAIPFPEKKEFKKAA